jgi:outer membrane lipoprotein
LKRRFLLTLCFSGVIASCAPLSSEIMRQVDESLTYQVVQQDPQRYSGKTVLWGGVIIETINKMDVTVMKVGQTELDFEKRPQTLDRSAGRFLVRSAGFLDPAIYREGREITVAGEVAGKEILPLGDTQYSYPVILAKEIYLWEKRKPYYPYGWDYPYGWYGYPYGWYPPYYW